MKLNKAVLAMLLPTGDPDAICPDYIEKLLQGFENSRAHRASDLAKWASDDSLDLEPETVAAIRATHLDSFLDYTAHDMKAILLGLMDEDDARAAALFIHGHEHRYWKATAAQLHCARELSPCELPRPKAKARAALVDLEPMWTCRRASQAMHRVLNDPKATDAHKLSAINLFFDALDVHGYGHIKDAVLTEKKNK